MVKCKFAIKFLIWEILWNIIWLINIQNWKLKNYNAGNIFMLNVILGYVFILYLELKKYVL